MKEKALKISHVILLFIITILLVTGVYLKIKFTSINFEEILFLMRGGTGDSDFSVLYLALEICTPIVLVLFAIVYGIFYDITFGKKELKIKNKKIYPFNFVHNHRILLTVIFFLLSIGILAWSSGLINYVIYTNSASKFIENNYVDVKEANVTFKQKRNLIFIVSESLETTMFTKEQGGAWKYEVMPELYNLLDEEDVVTFYDDNKAEGLNMLQGTSWTTAALVANTSGLPLKIRINKNQYHSKNFMNGTYGLGDLLEDNGYNNELISSAKTSFGGLKEMFTRHGNYNIIDVKNLKDYGFSMGKEDKGKWGFNDNKLFEVAKVRVDELAKKKEPFNLELVTIDTHFYDGFVGDYSESKFKEQYENAYATQSRQIYDFVNYIRSKDYYKNTTIVIVGDHLSMQDDFFKKRGAKKRYVYNCIVNPGVEIKNNKNRIATSLDMYPTIVSSIGGIIDGDKLGLGVNLFSGKTTLAEKYGVKKLNSELKKKSNFYNDKLLNDEYLKKYEVKKGSK